MLFELTFEQAQTGSLRPLPFKDFSDIGRDEKDLEHLLADNLNRTLYQQAPLMPLFQERDYQPEADLYALNESGDLVIFELKRGGTGTGALEQVLRYAEEAGQWGYTKLSDVYDKYRDETGELQAAHRQKFGLNSALPPEQFNQRQELRIVGNASNRDLIEAVKYWSRQGLNISFVPYRIYEIDGSHYFEFFAKPNDQRVNPADRKGVLFDTNRTYDEDAIWDMFEKNRIAAYGDQRDQADYLDRGDIVFYYHRGEGVVAAAKVVSETKEAGSGEMYHDVDFLTPIPESEDELTALSPARVQDVTGESFFWARTAKYPYLTHDQARELASVLQEEL